MGQRFPKILKYRKVFKAFKRVDFKKVSQSGSHIKLKKKINEKEKPKIPVVKMSFDEMVEPV